MASNSNPFDLTQFVSGGKLTEKSKYKPEIYTATEWRDMLQGYEKVSPGEWAQISVGTHIRYVRKDGEMRKGGFIKYADPNGKFLSISSADTNVNSNAPHWKLPLDGVAEIWKIMDGAHVRSTSTTSTHTATHSSAGPPATHSSANGPTSIQESINRINNEIEQLKGEIQRVLNQQKRIIKSIRINAMRLERIEKNNRR
jgi:hypothetical protein